MMCNNNMKAYMATVLLIIIYNNKPVPMAQRNKTTANRPQCLMG